MKAILVIDMPKCCEECRLINRHYDNEDGEWQTYCAADYHRIREKNKKYYCPLKPMPQKLAENFGNNTPTNTYIMNGTERQYLDMFAVGYNRCIDEILGEEK